MEIRYFVRTTGKRKLSYDLDYELLVDKEHKPVESFISQLKYISKYDSVLLEDDLVLCNNFKEEIEKVIGMHPDMIINFFTSPEEYFKTRKSYSFSYNQCTYYPKGISARIAEKMEQRPKTAYDIMESVALRELRTEHIQHRPCLVQHKSVNSLIGNNLVGSRITIYFKDWLDKYGIDYKEAENDKRLMREKKQFITQLLKEGD